MIHRTEQEAFLAGEFGTAYIQRNQGDALQTSNLDFFATGLQGATEQCGVMTCP